MTLLVAALLGVVVGLVMGLTGAGGTLLALPLLMKGLGLSLTEAVPVSLMAVAIGAAIGSWRGLRESLLRYRAGALIAFAGLLASPLGLWFGERLPVETLTLIFAGVLLVAAGRQLWLAWQAGRNPVTVPEAVQLPALCPINPDTGRFRWTPRTALIMSGIGAVAGLLSGLFGVGGGFIVLPALLHVSKLSFAACVATTLMVLALVSTGTLAMAVIGGRDLLWMIALPFSLALMVSLVAGQRLAMRLPNHWVQVTFAVVVVGVAVLLAHEVLA